METFGFIHGELDIKILILFVLRRLPSPVDGQTLSELCSCDTGIGWFDYADCLAQLVQTGHVDEPEKGRYVITEKGARNGETAETSLPYSVRTKAEALLAPVAERMRRDLMIRASHEPADGGCAVSLAMSDGKGEILSLRLLAPDEAQARAMEKNFRLRAESIYGEIAAILMKAQDERE